MVFSSLMFLFVYLPVVLAVYYVVPLKGRNPVLFAASLLFYGWGEPVYLAVMIASIAVNYGFGLLVEKFRAEDKRARRVVLLSVLFNLALLFFFKYFDFVIENLRSIRLFSSLKPLGLTLPIGISFYTFQTMSYTIDVYRGEARAQRNFVTFGTFVTLFPQLIAGPILQYRDLDDQLRERSTSVSQFASGVEVFVVGLAKKVLLANSVGALWDVYKAAAAPSCVGAWLGVIAFTFQIYFDFSGYSDMAIGLGRFFGFHFLENFNYPYESRTVTEFWRRWHISLSTWFREYVYIPLGGNRKGLGRQLVNITIVWFLTGLWHGASWNFVLWGVYYAALLILEKTFLLRWLGRAPRFVGHVYTCLCFVLGWVLFAITDFGQLGAYLGHLFSGPLWDSTSAYLLRCDWLLLVLAVIGCTSLPKRLWEKREQTLSPALSDGLRTVWAVIVLLVSIAFLVGDSYNPFLYFRF